MSGIDRMQGQISEMYVWLDCQGIRVYNVVYVSPETYTDLTKELSKLARHRDSLMQIGKYGRLCVETCYAPFFIEAMSGIDADDMQMKDLGGFMHSYQNHYVSEMVEQTILKGRV